MQFLITGIAGFLGSALAKHLIHEGHQVRGIITFQQFHQILFLPKSISHAVISTTAQNYGLFFRVLIVLFILLHVCSSLNHFSTLPNTTLSMWAELSI